MTLEEAIKHTESVAKDYDLKSELCTLKDGVVYPLSEEEKQKCKDCTEEHRQLAEWLKDYNRLLSAIDDNNHEEKSSCEFTNSSVMTIYALGISITLRPSSDNRIL